MQYHGIEYSPLFSFFDLTLPYGNDIKLFKENTILVQYMKNEEFRKERENTLIRKTCKRYGLWRLCSSKQNSW